MGFYGGPATCQESASAVSHMLTDLFFQNLYRQHQHLHLQRRKQAPLNKLEAQGVREKFRWDTQCLALEPRAHSFTPCAGPTTTSPASSIRPNI